MIPDGKICENLFEIRSIISRRNAYWKFDLK